MGGKQPLKIEGYCNRNWLSEHFHPPGEKGRFQTEVIKKSYVLSAVIKMDHLKIVIQIFLIF